MTTSRLQNGFAKLGVVMVTATITLVGFVAFRFLEAQDNTQVATTPQPTSQVASIKSVKDVETVTKELDTTEVDSLDAELDAEFSF